MEGVDSKGGWRKQSSDASQVFLLVNSELIIQCIKISQQFVYKFVTILGLAIIPRSVTEYEIEYGEF